MTRTKDQAAAVLPTLLKALRLPSINRNWKHLTDTADRDGWPAANLLASLLEIEMADRSSRRLQCHRYHSGLPAGHTLDRKSVSEGTRCLIRLNPGWRR